MLEELKCYLQEPLTKWRVNNAMEWWSDHEVKFPHVALMAQKYLAIPASSAPLRGYSLYLDLSWNVNGGKWMEEGLKGLSFCDATKTSMHNLYY